MVDGAPDEKISKELEQIEEFEVTYCQILHAQLTL